MSLLNVFWTLPLVAIIIAYVLFCILEPIQISIHPAIIAALGVVYVAYSVAVLLAFTLGGPL